MNRTTAEERKARELELIREKYKGLDAVGSNIVWELNCLFDHEDALKRIGELEKAKDNAHAERNKCVVGLALLARDLGYRVGLARHPEEDKEWDDDWRNIVFIELPTGQISWHLHDSEMYMLYSFCREGYKYDGHTTEEKYRRLLDYSLKNYTQLY